MCLCGGVRRVAGVLLDTELPDCPVNPKILIGVCHVFWAFTLNPTWLTFKLDHWASSKGGREPMAQPP